EEPKRVHQALKDPSWIEAMQVELLQFKMQKVWVLVDFPHGKRDIGKPYLGLWYPKDSPFDLVAYSDSDYAGASLDIKSTTRGCQFLGCRLISWQCKKQTVVATSSTEAEYVDDASCCAQSWLVQKQTALGKDKTNPLTVDSLLKIIWSSIHHHLTNEVLTIPGQTTTGVITPRCDEDRLELMELTVFKLPKVEKVRIRVSVVDLQVSVVSHMLLISVKSALTMKPNIYVSCIKQFWTTVAVKKVNDIIRLQALVDKKKVVVTEATIREALRLDDAEGVECLPNEEIIPGLVRMGYEKRSTKLTFYKTFFSS
nr:putative ribonuclease H-like domain-containing protein [Tanacetum cinerariifolium]